MKFDQFSQTYQKTLEQTLANTGADADAVMVMKVAFMVDLLQQYRGSPAGLNALDVGCGIGRSLRYLQSHTSHLHGIDVSRECLKTAAENSPMAHLRRFDGYHIPYDDSLFDLTFAICVFHHVAREKRSLLLAEMRRVTKAGGVVILFEHNPINPVTRWIVAHCPFDRDALLLGRDETRSLFTAAGFQAIHHCYIGFFPWRIRFFEMVERSLGWLPLGAQFGVWSVKSPAA